MTAKHILISICLAALPATAAEGATVKVALDSAHITMGYTTPLRITVTDRNARTAPGVIVVPWDSVPPQLEIVERRDTLPPLKADGKLWRATYTLQSFDSGAWRLPPLMYISDGDTAWSNPVTLKVLPVDVNGMETIETQDGPESVPSKWYDWMPNWLIDYYWAILLAIVILIGAVCAYLLLTKKVNVRLTPQKKPEPPYDVALKKLEALRAEQLWEHGAEKQYYTRLTDILREYLDKRFGINAMEMTSSQIIRAIEANETTRMSRSLMQRVLEIADFVKFAKAQPLRDDNIRSFDAALRFVEDTKPVEQPADGQAADGDADKPSDVKPANTEKP